MSVFSRPEVRRALKDFVPVAQDVMYTQYRWVEEPDELKTFFDGIMQRTRNPNGRGERATRQGFYVFDAAGRSLGVRNSRRVRGLLSMLARAREAFEADPPTRLQLPRTVPVTRPRPPVGAAVVRVFARIDPVPAGSDRRNRTVGRDFLWVRRDELRSLARGQVPPPLAGRIVRFHLIDTIRGEPDPWSREHVERAQFRARVRQVEDRLVVSIAGRFRLRAPGIDEGRWRGLEERGYEGRLEGELEFAVAGTRLLRVEMLAEGHAWGRSRYNDGEPPGRFPLKVAFVLGGSPGDHELPPGMYFHDWNAYWNPGVEILGEVRESF